MKNNQDNQVDRRSNQRDFFDNFMFGKRVDEPEPTENQLKSVEKYFENVNVDELMENIDFIMTTAKQVKPYINKLSPLLKQFLK